MSDKPDEMALPGCLISVLTLPWWGWTFATIWRWHAVPLGAPALSAGTALGLLTLVQIVRHRSPRKGAPELDYRLSMIQDVFVPAIWLGVAWLARFM